MTTNIQVEITDPHTFHCFRLVLNPQGVPALYCETHAAGECDGNGPSCVIREHMEGEGRVEVMLHARSLVDLIHKCNVALCEWQQQTSQELIEKLTRYASL